MMTISEDRTGFPEFVRGLPEADLPVAGLRGWLLQSERGQVLFMEASAEIRIPEHAHGDQWGIVVDGSMEITIGGVLRACAAGDSYFIPGGTIHSAVLHPGFRAIDYFADRERYRAK